VLFWEDSWNGLPPLTTLYSFRLRKHICCQCWGVHVQDYFKEVDPTSGLVTWKNPDDLPIPKEIKNDFVNECKSRMVLVSLFNDELIWAPTQEGKYSVKFGLFGNFTSDFRYKEIQSIYVLLEFNCLTKSWLFLLVGT